MKISIKRLEGGRIRISVGREIVHLKTQTELEAFWAGFRVAHVQISDELLERAKRYPYYTAPQVSD